MKLVTVTSKHLLNFMYLQNGVLKILKINKLPLDHLITQNSLKNLKMQLLTVCKHMSIYWKMVLAEKSHAAFFHYVLTQSLSLPATSIHSCIFLNSASMQAHNMKSECTHKQCSNFHYHIFLYRFVNGNV